MMHNFQTKHIVKYSDLTYLDEKNIKEDNLKSGIVTEKNSINLMENILKFIFDWL